MQGQNADWPTVPAPMVKATKPRVNATRQHTVNLDRLRAVYGPECKARITADGNIGIDIPIGENNPPIVEIVYPHTATNLAIEDDTKDSIRYRVERMVINAMLQ